MTDLEHWMAFLAMFKIAPVREVHLDGVITLKMGGFADTNTAVTGYPGFYVSVLFDKSGKFIEIGAYE